MDWKHEFTKVLTLCLQERTNLMVSSDLDIFTLSKTLTNRQRRGIWIDVSKSLGIG